MAIVDFAGNGKAGGGAVDFRDYDIVTVTLLPTASEDTMKHIYQVGPDANNNYDRYYTQKSGNTYSWVPMGSTQMDLSDYATDAELIQLEAKIAESDGVTSEAFAELYERVKLLEARLTDEYNRIKVYAKDIHAEDIYQYEVPAVLECSTAGAPAAARIPDNWDLDTMGVWSGVPRFIGQVYVDTASKKVYMAAAVTNSTNDWVLLN